MSESPQRGGQYPPPQGGGTYGPPPPYQGPQWQQPQQPQQQQQQWQQPQQQQQWQEPQQQQWQTSTYENEGGGGYDPTLATGDLVTATILRRAGARIIDNGLVAVFGFALILPFTIGIFGLETSGSKASSEGAVWNWPIIITMFAVLAVLPFVYEAVQLSMWGRTLGKRFLHVGVVQRDPLGESVTTAQAVFRAAVNNIGYQIGVFFFLILAVKVWEYAAYGMLLAWAGGLMAYLWAIWDEPWHQALHDRFAGTIVIDEREYADGGYSDGDQTQVGYSEYEG
ncbi:RDD family protein [Actinomadura macrotermitis]|uniref:RDD domain-containing protein n=1 Tax=Actinomadura macrotermitis TaxID=2585200 RepID=A0A7K0BXQ7_9ACTN|nr:RDD family protein [Actinomadura macrotermitis]MQY05965.1 hypothetical protein [Actinomadura macrotermitis]